MERDGTGIRLIVLYYLLRFLDEESEGKIILKSALILKNLKRLFTQNAMSLKDINTIQDLTP
jgi:hypothetical protein